MNNKGREKDGFTYEDEKKISLYIDYSNFAWSYGG